MPLDTRDPLLKAVDDARIASLLSSKDAEIERLRAALQKIASYEITDNLNYYNARVMIEMAQAALKE